MFRCPAGYGIPIELKCDGLNNCGDNADEEDCPKACDHHCSNYPQRCFKDRESVDIRSTNDNAIFNAIKAGNLMEVERQLRQTNTKNPVIANIGLVGKDKDTPMTALHYAANQGKFDIYKSISAELTNINPGMRSGSLKGRTPLHEACQYGHLEIVKYTANCLLDKSPYDVAGSTPMHLAAEYGHTDIVQFFIDNLQNKNPPKLSDNQYAQQTPLHNAAWKGYLDIVKMITNEIADKNPKDIHGYTPLHSAAFYGHLEVVRHLTTLVRNVDIKTDSYWDFKTPVQWAAEKGHTDIVDFLISKGADSSTAYKFS